MQEVIATPMLQPAFKPTYTLEQAMTIPSSMPITTARVVSCRMRSPW